MAKPRAFIAEPCARFDVSQISEWADVVYLFPEDGSRSAIFSEPFMREVAGELALQRFDPEKDYIVAAGPFAIVVLFIAIAASHYEKMKILLFNAHEQRYITKVIGGLTGERSSERDLPQSGDVLPGDLRRASEARR